MNFNARRKDLIFGRPMVPNASLEAGGIGEFAIRRMPPHPFTSGIEYNKRTGTRKDILLEMFRDSVEGVLENKTILLFCPFSMGVESSLVCVSLSSRSSLLG